MRTLLGFTYLAVALLFSNCVNPPNTRETDVKLQVQGRVEFHARDGSGWGGAALLLVREDEEHGSTFEIRQAEYGTLYLEGRLRGRLEDDRESSGLQEPWVEGSNVEVRKEESLRSIILDSQVRLRRGIEFATLRGAIRSTGTRWANYREGTLRTGRDSRVELSLRDAWGAHIHFSGETHFSERTHVLGTSIRASLDSTGSNSWTPIGDEALFVLDFPRRAGAVESTRRGAGYWRRDFTFETQGQARGGMQIAKGADGASIQVHDRLAVEVAAAPVTLERTARDPVILLGTARIAYDLEVTFTENRIEARGRRELHGRVERRDGSGSTRFDRPEETFEHRPIRW